MSESEVTLHFAFRSIGIPVDGSFAEGFTRRYCRCVFRTRTGKLIAYLDIRKGYLADSEATLEHKITDYVEIACAAAEALGLWASAAVLTSLTPTRRSESPGLNLMKPARR